MKFFNYEEGGCMNTQLVTADFRMSKWAQIIKERQNSGQTIKEFCEERGIKEGAYFYWQRKLRGALCTELANLNEPATDIPAGWVQLEPATGAKEALTVEVAGCRIRVTPGTDPELLKMVCRTLRAL